MTPTPVKMDLDTFAEKLPQIEQNLLKHRILNWIS